MYLAYNAFLGRPALAKFRVAIAPWFLTRKFPIENNVGIVQGDQMGGCERYVTELKEAM